MLLAHSPISKFRVRLPTSLCAFPRNVSISFHVRNKINKSFVSQGILSDQEDFDHHQQRPEMTFMIGEGQKNSFGMSFQNHYFCILYANRCGCILEVRLTSNAWRVCSPPKSKDIYLRWQYHCKDPIVTPNLAQRFFGMQTKAESFSYPLLWSIVPIESNSARPSSQAYHTHQPITN